MTFWLALHRHDSGASEEKVEEKIPKDFEKAFDSVEINQTSNLTHVRNGF